MEVVVIATVCKEEEEEGGGVGRRSREEEEGGVPQLLFALTLQTRNWERPAVIFHGPFFKIASCHK